MLDGLDPADLLGERGFATPGRALDPDDPINAGALGLLALDDGGGARATDMSPWRRHGALTAASWEPGPYGLALKLNGSTSYADLGFRPLNNLAQGSVFLRFKPNAGGGVLLYEDGSGFNNFTMFCPAVGTDVLRFHIGGATNRDGTSRTWDANTWYSAVVTWGPDIRIYINGVLDATIAAAGGTANTPGDNDQIGRYSFGGGNVGQYSSASVSHYRPFARVLSPTEVQRLHLDPWSGVIDPDAALYFFDRAASTAAAYTMPLSAGIFTATGQAVNLRYGRRLPLASGSFTLSGQNIALKFGRRLALSHGSFTLTGQDVTLRRGYSLPLSAGAFTLSGQDVGLRAGRRLPLSHGSFLLTGQTVTLRRGYSMPISAGTFALTGQAVALRAGRRLALTAGSFTLTGQPVTFNYSGSGVANKIVLVWNGIRI